jgi:SAM-dependent methyltransferase
VRLASVLDDCRHWITQRTRSAPRPEAALEQCYWLLLGRAVDAAGRRTHLPLLAAGREGEVVDAILASRELQERCASGSPAAAPSSALRTVLSAMGSDAAFVDRVHTVILGRRPRSDERRACAERLRGGGERAELVRALLAAPEFAERCAGWRPGPVPADHQLCELANPAKWDNQEWLAVLRSLEVIPAEKTAMHRKGYEYTQTVFGLRRLGIIREDARVLSVGAGHEPVLYWLANHVQRVVATDLFGSRWQSSAAFEGDARMLQHPGAFAPFAYRQERLDVLRMDGVQLAFADDSFDAVYSLSSIEHFGAWAEAKRAVDEMARVLKPGGVLALATEWCVAGPPCAEVFTPQEVRRLIESPMLALVEPVDDHVWHRYRTEVVDLARAPQRTPHMLVRRGDTVFTSVMLFLRKAARPAGT